MSKAIPENLRTSTGLQFVISQGWNWQGGDGGQIQVEVCPFCKKGDFKFYMAVANPAESTRDGLYFCHHGSCAKTGNLRTLQEALGVRIPGIDSRKEWAGIKGDRKPDELPDVELCHSTLLGDADAMDYLLNVRGFTKEIIARQKLGLKEKVWFREAGESKALVIPYLVGGNVVYAKFRTLPPKPKDFVSPTGWEAPLYNGEILQEGIREIIFVEGEADALSLMSSGVDNVVGVPGANVKKAAWIETLDKVNPEKIYIMYDNDKVGAKAAQEIASRIGIDKCLKIVLPPDTKDINEYFQKGGTLEGFEKLKENAQLFDVTGVVSSGDALTQLEDELNGKKDLAPTYLFPWPELNRLLGMEDGDVLDIVAPEKVGKTTLGMNIMDHMVATYGEDGLIVCLEMTQARLAKKWVSLVTGFEDTMTEPGTEESKAKLEELKGCVVKARETQQNRDADLYFAYPLQWQDNPESVFKLMRDCIRRYGVKWIMFDNLQKFCDESLKNQGHRTIYLSQLSKKLASIAKDYKIKMIRILQPKRIMPGMIISTNDVDGSSQVAKDCDGMITAWRKVVGEMKKSEFDEESAGFVETDMSFEPKMKLTNGLSRYSSGGSAYVYYDGARSLVRSYTSEEKSGLNTAKQNFNNIVVPTGPVAVATEVTTETPVKVQEEEITP